MPNVAKEIRTILNEKGYSSRKISVTEQQGGYSWCFNVVIKDSTIDIKVIKDALKHLTKVDRDKSGETLSGGNTYIFVSYQ